MFYFAREFRPMFLRFAKRLGLLVMSLVSALFVACSSSSPPGETPPDARTLLAGKVALAPTPAQSLRFTILHTNDVRGYVDPCG